MDENMAAVREATLKPADNSLKDELANYHYREQPRQCMTIETESGYTVSFYLPKVGELRAAIKDGERDEFLLGLLIEITDEEGHVDPEELYVHQMNEIMTEMQMGYRRGK